MRGYSFPCLFQSVSQPMSSATAIISQQVLPHVSLMACFDVSKSMLERATKALSSLVGAREGRGDTHMHMPGATKPPVSSDTCYLDESPL